MCICPVSIPYDKYASRYVSEFGNVSELPNNLKLNSNYIEVACGKCSECRNKQMNAYIQRALCESMSSYVFFVTLTYDNNHIPSLKLPSGDLIFYYNFEHLKLLFKRLRVNTIVDRDFRYISVNEYGDTNHRPHAHLLLFVAKKDNDPIDYALHFEKRLFRDIKKYYALNVGTRKQPKYEPLFTYRVRGKYSNYVCKLVTDEKGYTDNLVTYLKTIRYLVGYLNKGSSFDRNILQKLDKINDSNLQTKLKNLLKSRVYFSKGFGCGFAPSGQKIYFPKISAKISSNSIINSQLFTQMPKDRDEFRDSYFELYDEVEQFKRNIDFTKFVTFDDYISILDSHQFMLLLLYVRYFNDDFTRQYTFHYRISFYPALSCFYFRKPTPYYRQRVNTSLPIDSPLAKFLNSCVSKSIEQALPFFQFITPNYSTALCSYYQDRFVTVADTLALYDALGVSSTEEYIKKFTAYKSLMFAEKSQGNLLKYEENDFRNLECQKNCLPLSQTLQGSSLYTSVL